MNSADKGFPADRSPGATPDSARSRMVVYNGSVSVDVLVENNTDRSRIEPAYDNLMIEGSIVTHIHPNLHKTKAYACTPAKDDESSFTDLVISKDGSSVRFGEYDYMTTKGRVLASTGPSVEFEERIGEDLGVHYSLEDSSCVTVYTEKDYLHSQSRGVMVFAPNFIAPRGNVGFTPATSIRRPGCIKIRPEGLGNLRNMDIKGSLFVDTFVRLTEAIVPPIGGWYFGDRRDDWYKPPSGMIVPEKQTGLGIAGPGDLVISRGNASVLIRADGSAMVSGFAALLYVPVSYGKPVSVNLKGESTNGGKISMRPVVVFQ